jgi:hypothetical protein
MKWRCCAEFGKCVHYTLYLCSTRHRQNVQLSKEFIDACKRRCTIQCRDSPQKSCMI